MHKHRILIVDDEVGFTRLVKLVLRRYDICEENNPRRALQTALEFRPQLILLDVVMPGIDGGNLAARFQDDPILRHVPIVFLTAVVSKDEAGDSARHIAGYSFLAKPVCPDVLERCIEEHLLRTDLKS